MKNTITKTQRFEDIINLLKGEATTCNTTSEIAIEFLQREIELLAKRSNSKSKQQQAKNEINTKLEEKIFDLLNATTDENGLKCSQIALTLTTDRSNPITAQKVSPIINKMLKANKVEKNIVKGVSYFKITKEENNNEVTA